MRLPIAFSISMASLSIAAFGCGSDESDTTPPAGESTYQVGYDEATELQALGKSVSSETALWVEDGPMLAEATANRSIEYKCGQTAVGSCPSVTAACDAEQVTGATLEYKEADACKDRSGESLKGTVVFTRNAKRDWTVALQLQRGPVSFEGQLGFKTSPTQPWSISITDLKVKGSLEASKADPDCAQNCVSSTVVSVCYDVVLSTGTPISADLTLVGSKSVKISGSLAASGKVTGHVTVQAKGPLGGSQTPVDKSIDSQLNAQSMTLSEVVYGIPPACTCPASGSLQTTSLLECGSSTVSFVTPQGGTCPAVSVVYGTSSTFCNQAATAAAMALQSRCVPYSK